MAFAWLLIGFLIGELVQQEAPTPSERIRLAVLTDISSLTAGVAEPDDGQSLIRLMLYADEFEIEALVASSNLGHGQRTRPELIRQVVDAYEKVRPNLLRHEPRYPPADALKRVIKAGQDRAGPKLKVEESIGEGKDTQGSSWLIECVDRPDSRPLWVAIWGGSADLAQALWRVRRDRTADQLRRFVSSLRVHSIGDQDSTGPWIREQFPDLFVITQRRAYRGMYRGGDRRLVSSEWVEANIHGHGALGDLYPNYRGGDIWSATLGPVRGIKEGDTPSFLSLVPNGLGDPDRPGLGGWGGRFEGKGRQLTDVPDLDLDTSSDPDPRMSSVYRWRAAFQADFAARLDWCVKPFEGANHPPVVRIEGPRLRSVKAGKMIALDASGSTDPDGQRLAYEWAIYPPDARIARLVTIRDGDTPASRLEVGPVGVGEEIAVLLRVTDDGNPKLTRYGRIILQTGSPD